MKKTLYKLGRFSGLPFFFRTFVQRNKVTFLSLHNPKPEVAEKSFNYLQKRYNVISLNQYVDAVLNHKDLPKRAMVITLDDGYIGNYELLPIVKKLQIPISIFLCAAIVGTHRKFWFEFDDMPIDEIAKLNRKLNKTRLETLSNLGFSRDQEHDVPSALQREHLIEMKDFIDLQAHAKYHPVFPNCTEDEVWDEVNGARKILENDYALSIYAIAYPNGEYSERDILLVKKSGYTCAITADYGFNDKSTDLFRLKRLLIRDDHDMHQLIVKSSGAWGFIKTLIKYQPRSGYTSNC